MLSPENPAAFPCSVGDVAFWNEGMTLRDYFAAHSLPMVWQLAREHASLTGSADHFVHAVARDAYDLADAMLAARQDRAS